MVSTQHRSSARPYALHRGEMFPRINLVRHLAFSDVARADVFLDHIVLPHQQAAAFEWKAIAGVFNHARKYVTRNLQRHASIIIAVPMPPPTQSDATPRPPPRA